MGSTFWILPGVSDDSDTDHLHVQPGYMCMAKKIDATKAKDALLGVRQALTHSSGVGGMRTQLSTGCGLKFLALTSSVRETLPKLCIFDYTWTSKVPRILDPIPNLWFFWPFYWVLFQRFPLVPQYWPLIWTPIYTKYIPYSTRLAHRTDPIRIKGAHNKGP